MGSIVIHTSNNEDLTLLKELAEKMRLRFHILSDAEKEDLVIASAIEENDDADRLSLNDAKEYYNRLIKQNNDHSF